MLFYPGTDLFSKIIPVPIANAAVPRLEQLATKLASRWPRLGSKRANGAATAAWLSLSIVMLILNTRW